MHTSDALINFLIEQQLIDSNQALLIARTVTKGDASLIYTLVHTYCVDSHQLLLACSIYFSLPIFDLNADVIHQVKKDYFDKNQKNTQGFTSTKDIQADYVSRLRLFPISATHQEIALGVSDPTYQQAFNIIRFETGKQIKLYLVDEIKLSNFLEGFDKALAKLRLQLSLNKIEHTVDTENIESAADIIDESEPVIQWVDRLLNDAIEKKSSDIHIEPLDSRRYRIRYRRDGLLVSATELSTHTALRIMARLKLLAQLNMTEKRRPQDGRLKFIANTKQTIDLRLSTIATLHGEKMVLRLLNQNSAHLNIHELGMSDDQAKLLSHYLNQTQGLIIVTGPTGSGKTTTLYSALHAINQVDKNITTIEDPIEIELEGINQTTVQPRLQLDFVTLLRAILRQDPDVIMLGEIRDKETAEIAMQAAQTGHLVLTTLHTNGATDTIIRLQSMGLANHHIANAVTLIIAQRLLRKICSYCHANLMKGCQKCYQGFLGRLGVYEMLEINPACREAILHNPQLTHSEIKENTHFSNLYENALSLVSKELTTIHEVKRILG